MSDNDTVFYRAKLAYTEVTLQKGQSKRTLNTFIELSKLNEKGIVDSNGIKSIRITNQNDTNNHIIVFFSLTQARWTFDMRNLLFYLYSNNNDSTTYINLFNNLSSISQFDVTLRKYYLSDNPTLYAEDMLQTIHTTLNTVYYNTTISLINNYSQSNGKYFKITSEAGRNLIEFEFSDNLSLEEHNPQNAGYENKFINLHVAKYPPQSTNIMSTKQQYQIQFQDNHACKIFSATFNRWKYENIKYSTCLLRISMWACGSQWVDLSNNAWIIVGKYDTKSYFRVTDASQKVERCILDCFPSSVSLESLGDNYYQLECKSNSNYRSMLYAIKFCNNNDKDNLVTAIETFCKEIKLT